MQKRINQYPKELILYIALIPYYFFRWIYNTLVNGLKNKKED